MPADSEHNEEHGLSRRQVLARGAVAAGVVWAAPVIRTATAYATSSAGTERPCINFYLVAIDPLGIRPVRFAPDAKFGYDEVPDSVLAAMAAATTTTTSSTTTSSTTTTTKPPAAAQRRAPRRTTTTTSSTTTSTTTTTTRPDVADRGDDESATRFVPEPTTPTTAPRPPATTTPTTRAPAAPKRATPKPTRPTEDFGLFESAVTPAPTAPGAPPDPHAVAIAAATAAAEAGTPDPLPPGIKTWLTDHNDVPLRYPVAEPMVTQMGDEAWAVLLAPVDGPDPLTHQCRAVNGWATAGGKHTEFFVDPNPSSPEEDGRRLIFPNPRSDDLVSDPSALIETVIFVFCCPQ